MKKTYIYLLTLLVFLVACKKDKEEISKKAGFFRVALVNAKKNYTQVNDINSEFNLGEVKSSQRFYFQLVNGGDYSIDNITINSENSNFQVTPKRINQLSKDQASLNQILSLDVIHGTQLNGIGYTNVLNKGINFTTLTIKGRTFNGKDSLDISQTYKLIVDAKLMDCIFYSNNTEIDITKPRATAYGYIYYFNHSVPNDTIKIVNTGNVNLTVSYGWDMEHTGSTNIIYHDFVIPPNKFQKFYGWQMSEYVCFVLSSGTIANSSKFHIHTDGKIYINF